MSKFTQGCIALLAIAVNLIVSGKMLYLSWFESGLPPTLAAFLLFWFLLNIALAFVAFGPEAKD